MPDPAVARVAGLADRAAAERAPAWLDLVRRYGEWELAEAAEAAVRVLRSADPGAETRVHRALLTPPPARPDAGGVVRLLLCCAAASDVRDLGGLPGEPALGDVAVIEPLVQLQCYAGDLLGGRDPVAVLGGVPE
ncbi:hypothetical protein [Actinomadura sp. NEAU-AAG7]|uniref:hypothetical protein n=1 Tax=Actinomadura sp. NEAU-AAG7 TaxID=2839640 RepID=UPI001BE4D399|nr:hypothetical protein [Actinomadura sp. NEAU-AAG7]MBT2208814.1 hypothetical protein [Actinomadura sp. NEAU-AAG7]